MRVAILGGWDQEAARNKEWAVEAGRRSQAQIIEACRAIGERLARNKHSVIVGSEKKNSADYHVVHAMLNNLDGPNGSLPWIEVIEGIEKKEPLYKNERENPKYSSFFSPINQITSGRAIRSAEKIMAVQKADAVITIGGLNDTWTGGIAAIVARKPVVPLGTFGGASQHLLQALNSLDHALKSPDNNQKFNRLANKVWNPALIDTVFDLGGLSGDRVFFGYCSKARSTANEITKYLRSLGLDVKDWATDLTSGRVILDEIDAAVSSCKYGVFLFTPDEPGNKPRDNVIFEAGYFMSAHGRDRTIIIVQRGTNVLADYGGHIYIDLEDPTDISTIKAELNRRLGKAPVTTL
jgi:CAP12/Pycsar effector protein, TIR domain